MTSMGHRSIGTALAVSTVLLATACGGASTGAVAPGTPAQVTSAGPRSTAAGTVFDDKATFLHAVSAGSRDLMSARFDVSAEGPQYILRGTGAMTRVSGTVTTQLQVRLGKPGPMADMLDAVVLPDEVLVLGLAETVDGPDWVRLTPGSDLETFLRGLAALAQPDSLTSSLDRGVSSIQHAEGTRYDVATRTPVFPAGFPGATAGTSASALSVGLDQQDRLTRLTGTENGVDWSLALNGFNEPVEVVVPSADQISTLKGY